MNAYAKVAVVLLAILLGFGAGWAVQGNRKDAKYDAEKLAISKAANAAIATRLEENAALVAENNATNDAITKAKDEQIASVTASLAAERLRRGTGICARPASAPATQSAPISTAADSASGAFRQDIERDFKSLIVEMETTAATGRACQAFVIQNGLQ